MATAAIAWGPSFETHNRFKQVKRI